MSSGWLNQFLLGRPNYEIKFTYNPDAMSFEDEQVAAVNRNLAGDRKKWVYKTSAPTLKINTKFLSWQDALNMRSLLGVTDTFLSLIVRNISGTPSSDLTQYYEKNTSLSTTTVKIQNNSATKLSTAVVAAGGSSTISIYGVFDNTAGTGTNYFTGGSYADSTRTITLGTALASSPLSVYVVYSFSGWLVDMVKMPSNYAGGRVDIGTYDIQLVGV